MSDCLQGYNVFQGIRQEATPLSMTFFSKKNIDFIQYSIRKRVFESTKKQIVKQNVETILIVMRSIYLQFVNMICDNILHELNKKVIDYCVGSIRTNLLQQMNYIKDINLDENGFRKPVVPIDFSESTKKFKQLPARNPF